MRVSITGELSLLPWLDLGGSAAVEVTRRILEAAAPRRRVKFARWMPNSPRLNLESPRFLR